MSLPEPSVAGLVGAVAALLSAAGVFATLSNSRANRRLLEAQADAAQATASQTSVSAAIALYQAVSKERDECVERLTRADEKLDATREELRGALALHDQRLAELREALRLRGVSVPRELGGGAGTASGGPPATASGA